MAQLRTIGIIGAGQMGTGIAQVCAVSGFQVSVTDLSETRIHACLNTIASQTARSVEHDTLTSPQRDAALRNLTPATDLAVFAEYDLIIEAASEDMDIKTAIFAALCPRLASHSILATNTSSLSITAIASTTDRPQQCIGIHFMNPVPRMGLVEVIRGLQTSETTFSAAQTFISQLGKTAIVSADSPGFIVNRILLPMINEAIHALHEGVGTIEAIDTALHLGASHPTGPLRLADLIGLDTCLAIMRTLHREFGDSKYRPCPLLTQYVHAGWLGKKTGRGFYTYHPDGAVIPSP